MKDWNWTEATDEEFERRGKKESYYKIFRLNVMKRKVRKSTVYKFWAKNRSAALRVLRRYESDHPGCEYYYATSGWCIGPDGRRYDDAREMFDMHRRPRDKVKEAVRRREFAKERDSIFIGTAKYIKSLKVRNENLRFVVKDILYFLSNYNLLSNRSHQKCEHWCVYGHIMETLEFNLPLLIKFKCGLPDEYCLLARKKLGEPVELRGNYSKKAMSLGEKLWNEELAKLLLYVRLYRYYEGYGIIDKTNRDEVAIGKEYAHTIPYIEGTYRDIDYGKLSKLCDKYWNLWIRQFHKIGRSLWD